MAKTLSKTLFGRNYTTGEWAVVITSLTAGILTIFQNLAPRTNLAAGIEGSITQSPISGWTLFLGVMLIVVIFTFGTGRKK